MRFELGRMEVAGVVVSTAAGLFVVFLLGIYAGRGMAERHLELDEEIVRLPVESEPVDSAAQDELTFYETLAGEARAAKRAEQAEKEAAARNAEPGAAAPEPAKVAAADAVADPAAKPAAPAEAPVEPKAAAPDAAAPAQTEPAAEKKPAPAAAEPKPAEEKARVAVALVDEPPAAKPPTSTGGEWSVQVAAPRDPRHAEQIRTRLKGYGFDTYIVKTVRGGETFYRVRVGHYESLELARTAANRLRGMPGVSEAFVTSN
jgi:cell division protein FtsN